MAALFEHKHWLEVIRDVRAFGEEGEIPPTPLPKAQAIAAVYFPDFDERIEDLDVAANAVELWSFRAEENRLQGGPGTDGCSAVYAPYKVKFFALIKDLRDFAKREFR